MTLVMMWGIVKCHTTDESFLAVSEDNAAKLAGLGKVGECARAVVVEGMVREEGLL